MLDKVQKEGWSSLTPREGRIGGYITRYLKELIATGENSTAQEVGLELVVLGNQSPYPGPGGVQRLPAGEAACCWIAVAASANLARHLPLWQLDAVVLSHLQGTITLTRWCCGMPSRPPGRRVTARPAAGVWAAGTVLGGTLAPQDNLVLHPWQPGQTST